MLVLSQGEGESIPEFGIRAVRLMRKYRERSKDLVRVEKPLGINKAYWPGLQFCIQRGVPIPREWRWIDWQG
jgi:hypothetical protein